MHRITTSPFFNPAPMLLLAFCTLLFVACDSDSSNPDGDSPGSRGEGTLVLDGVTYEFDVRACDFTGESDDDLQTLSGRGVDSDGEQFDVFASRNDLGDILSHSVSFYYTDDPAGTNIEAGRTFINGTWTSIHDEPNEPLIVISGNTLTASGVFNPSGDIDTTMDGTLTATCE